MWDVSFSASLVSVSLKQKKLKEKKKRELELRESVTLVTLPVDEDVWIHERKIYKNKDRK